MSARRDAARLELPAGFSPPPLDRHELAVRQPGDDRAIALYLDEWGPGGACYHDGDEPGWEQLTPIIRNAWRRAARVPLLPDTEFTAAADTPAGERIRFTIAVQLQVNPDQWDLAHGTGTLPEAVRDDVIDQLRALTPTSADPDPRRDNGLEVIAAYLLAQ